MGSSRHIRFRETTLGVGTKACPDWVRETTVGVGGKSLAQSG